MSLDYEKVWEVMNDLDEVVQRTKIINDMCTKLRKTVYDWTDADEVIDEIDALKGFSTYILQELEDKSINAWNNTVVPLNPKNETGTVKIGGDLDSLDINLPDDLTISTGNTATFNVDGIDYAGISTDSYNISLNTAETPDTITFSNTGYSIPLEDMQE